MSNCLWTLEVTVLMIDLKHAEKRNGEFCCCDDHDDDCKNSLSELEACEEGQCDILLSVTVSPCTEISDHGPCSVYTDEIKNAKIFGDNGYYFILHFTTTSQANNVRKCELIEEWSNPINNSVPTHKLKMKKLLVIQKCYEIHKCPILAKYEQAY